MEMRINRNKWTHTHTQVGGNSGRVMPLSSINDHLAFLYQVASLLMSWLSFLLSFSSTPPPPAHASHHTSLTLCSFDSCFFWACTPITIRSNRQATASTLFHVFCLHGHTDAAFRFPSCCCIPLFSTQTARYRLGIMSLQKRRSFGLHPAAEKNILLPQLLGRGQRPKPIFCIHEYIQANTEMEQTWSSAGSTVKMMSSNQCAENSAKKQSGLSLCKNARVAC